MRLHIACLRGLLSTTSKSKRRVLIRHLTCAQATYGFDSMLSYHPEIGATIAIARFVHEPLHVFALQPRVSQQRESLITYTYLRPRSNLENDDQTHPSETLCLAFAVGCSALRSFQWAPSRVCGGNVFARFFLRPSRTPCLGPATCASTPRKATMVASATARSPSSVSVTMRPNYVDL